MSEPVVMDGSIDRWVNRFIDGWVNGFMNGFMDGWMDEEEITLPTMMLLLLYCMCRR